jgi:hypothetical protein
MKVFSTVAVSAALLGALSASIVVDAQTPAKSVSFQSDLSALRKKVVPMCAQLQAGKPAVSQEKLLGDIDSIITGWKAITAAYKTNPPTEYAKDPSWQSYFPEALDNFEIMRARAEQENYKRAMQFCGSNCGVFVTMNQVNGVDKASDKMFMVRKNVKFIMDMVKAGNWKGAAHVKEHTAEMVAMMMASAAPAGADKAVFEQDMKSIKAAYDTFVEAVDKKDGKDAGVKFMAFMKTFAGSYSKYL